MLVRLAAVGAVTCLLAGCETTGLSPREVSGVSYPNYIFSLQSGTNGPSQKIVAPVRLVVAQIGEDAPAAALLDKLAADKMLVASVGGLPVPDEGQVGLNQPDYASRVKTVCGLAQAAGADYVFLIGGRLDTWQQHDFLSLLDFTIVGGTILPGTRIHVEGRGAGTLISTATCRPVLFVSADTRTVALSPDFLDDGKTVTLQARVRDELAGKLADRFLERLTACAGQ
jgi:hypothetical protein